MSDQGTPYWFFPHNDGQHQHGPSTSGTNCQMYKIADGNGYMRTSQTMQMPNQYIGQPNYSADASYNNQHGVDPNMGSWSTEDTYGYIPNSMHMDYNVGNENGYEGGSYPDQFIEQEGYGLHHGQGPTWIHEQYVPQQALYLNGQATLTMYHESYTAESSATHDWETGNVARNFSQSPIMAPGARVVPTGSRSSSGSPAHKPKLLIEFLLQLLSIKNGILAWINCEERIFQILDKEGLAVHWDDNKGRIESERKSYRERLRKGIYDIAHKGIKMRRMDPKADIYQFL